MNLFNKKQKQKWAILRVVCLIWCLGAEVATASSFSLTDSVFERAGEEFNLDPLLLYSISLVESAVTVPGRKGFLQPSPWTLRTDRPIYALSREDAELQLNRVLRTTRSVDIGLMQINSRWHGHRVRHLSDLLDPLTNVRVGAQILAEQMSRFPQDAARAVGTYHSADPERARWYARHVLRVYTKLKSDQFED